MLKFRIVNLSMPFPVTSLKHNYAKLIPASAGLRKIIDYCLFLGDVSHDQIIILTE